MTLANKITVLRILLVPPFLVLLLQSRYAAAAVLGVAMALSDALDGLVARRFKQQTRLGALLDPLADKLFLVSTFGALAWLGVVPAWVWVVFLSKDLLLSLGWALSFVLTGDREVETRWSGKAATALQMVFAAGVLAAQALHPGSEIVMAGLLFFQYCAVAATGMSMLDYLRVASRRLPGA